MYLQVTIPLKKNDGISSIKANRLYWMGRYAERVYLTLHMLRKHHDLMIDEDQDSYKDFCIRMGIADRYTSPENFITSYLYNTDNPDSIINMLEHLNDNAILLREEIKSETLSYIQLAINYMKSCKLVSKNLGGLQYITDCMLAFWGSVEERICTPKVRRIIIFGKFAESADLLLRFDYPLDRILNLCARMKECIDGDEEMFDEKLFCAFKGQLNHSNYKDSSTLAYLNGIFIA